MMDRDREAAVWARVRAAAGTAEITEKCSVSPQAPVQKREERRNGIRLWGGLPALVLVSVLLKRR